MLGPICTIKCATITAHIRSPYTDIFSCAILKDAFFKQKLDNYFATQF